MTAGGRADIGRGDVRLLEELDDYRGVCRGVGVYFLVVGHFSEWGYVDEGGQERAGYHAAEEAARSGREGGEAV